MTGTFLEADVFVEWWWSIGSSLGYIGILNEKRNGETMKWTREREMWENEIQKRKDLERRSNKYRCERESVDNKITICAEKNINKRNYKQLYEYENIKK